MQVRNTSVVPVGEKGVKDETLSILHKMCINEEISSTPLKEENFKYLIVLAKSSPSVEVRNACFKLIGSLSCTNSKQVVK
jgi:hypothetical protein